jgi:hypothetical protein
MGGEVKEVGEGSQTLLQMRGGVSAACGPGRGLAFARSSIVTSKLLALVQERIKQHRNHVLQLTARFGMHPSRLQMTSD